TGGAGETRAGLRAPPRAGLGKRALRPLPRHGRRARMRRRPFQLHRGAPMTASATAPRMSDEELLAIQPVIPVLTVARMEDAVPLAEALIGGGLRVLGVTLRTEAALDAIRRMKSVKGAIVGAGTVLGSNDVMLADEAGASFIVTPGLSAAAIAAAREANLPILPGVATATELMAGLDLGLDRFKFFPAEQAGGRAM